MEIRKATLADTEALRVLFNGALRHMAQLQPRQYRAVEQDTAFIQSGILEDYGDVLVAEDHGKIIGFVSVFAEETSPLPFRVQQKYCDLDNIFVAEEHRGKGVGTALFQAAWQWARERDLAFLQLMTLGENYNAQDFYEKMGMNVSQVRYILED